MKIKKGDKVVVIAGKDRGKTGTVARVLPKEDRVVIEGINVVKKHRRRTSAARAGQIVEKAMPIHASNIALADPKGGKATRMRVSRDGGVRVRIAVKSGSQID